MRSDRPQNAFPAVALALALAGSLSCASPLTAEDLDRQVAGYLAAGEFKPALVLACQHDQGPARDHLVGQVALAQARAGDRAAALRSAAEIASGQVRAGYLDRVSSQPWGAGGAAEADFESLIELITTTVEPNTWDEVGGPGAIDSFEGGVYVDAEGTLRRLITEDSSGTLAGLRLDVSATRPQTSATTGKAGARRESPLRMVSLPRLEKQIQLKLAAGEPLDEPMRVLAGLRRIEFVFVYPQQRDVVIAGPAGDWKAGSEERIVSSKTGEPVLQLDDLVVVFRHLLEGPRARFGCSITPTRDGLARVQAYTRETGKSPLRPGEREKWLAGLRASLGKQDIDVYGIDGRSRVARVLIEADYRMKLVGMGLEEGVLGVESYLDLIKIPAGGSPPPMDVLRWWFTLNYDHVLATSERNGFHLRGQGVKVLSENELLTQQGRRVHTGKSDAVNSQFAHSFTSKFDELARRYPIYAELRNVFDLAMVAALIRSEGLADKAAWQLTCFSSQGNYQPAQGPAAKQVETVINHRMVRRTTILAGVSGGVRCDPLPLVTGDAVQVDTYGKVAAERTVARPEDLDAGTWWWDQMKR